MDFIKQWVIQIVALVLFIVMVEMLLPTGKMKKYVGLVTGTILIISIISPLIPLLGKNYDFTAIQTTNSNAFDKLQVGKDSKLLEDEQMKQIVEVYRKKIIEQLEQNAKEIDGVDQVKADIIFNEDFNSETFGEIKRAYLEITTIDKTPGAAGTGSEQGDKDISVQRKAAEEGAKGQEEGEAEARGGSEAPKVDVVAKVEQVAVGKANQPQVSDESCDPIIKKNLEERIVQVFGIDGENIIISRKGG